MTRNWIKNSHLFLSQVLKELRHVVWPTRRDVSVTSVIVFVIAAICSVCLLLIDQVIVMILKIVFGISTYG